MRTWRDRFRMVSPSKVAEETGKAKADTWAERREAIMAVGPTQQCMSFVGGEPFGARCQVPCEAAMPHEHRAVVGGGRVIVPWGRGCGNPWEEADIERTNREWLQQSADAATQVES